MLAVVRKRCYFHDQSRKGTTLCWAINHYTHPRSYNRPVGNERNLAEIIPPEKPKLVQLWRWQVTPRQAWYIKLGAATAPCGVAAWLLQNFLQLRGVVNLAASRVDLAFFMLCLFVVGCVLTVGFPNKRVWRGSLFISAVMLYFIVDWLTPKPMVANSTAVITTRTSTITKAEDNGINAPTSPPAISTAQPHAVSLTHRPSIQPKIITAKTTPVPAKQPDEAPPNVSLSFDPNALSELLRSQPPAQAVSPILAVETSDDILEDIRSVLEKDRDSENLDGCPAGKSIALRRVGEDISYYVCSKQCFASWTIVNPKRLDFSRIQVSHPDSEPTLAAIEIPCLPATATTTQDYGLCITNQSGTFTTSRGCYKNKVKTEYSDHLYIVVHVENVDSIVRLWKKFSTEIK